MEVGTIRARQNYVETIKFLRIIQPRQDEHTEESILRQKEFECLIEFRLYFYNEHTGEVFGITLACFSRSLDTQGKRRASPAVLVDENTNLRYKHPPASVLRRLENAFVYVTHPIFRR